MNNKPTAIMDHAKPIVRIRLNDLKETTHLVGPHAGNYSSIVVYWDNGLQWFALYVGTLLVSRVRGDRVDRIDYDIFSTPCEESSVAVDPTNAPSDQTPQ